jgi:cyclic 2,3-diphosphoglycerate synthase
MTRPRALALIDGEHYPPVVAEAMRVSGDRYEYVAAVFLGGAEKIRDEALGSADMNVYGVPLVIGEDACRGLREAIERFQPEVVVDLSDEPVLGYKERFRLISVALAGNVSYEGPDFHFRASHPERLSLCPSLSIVGTAKRVGKTAVSGYAARLLQKSMTSEAGCGGGGKLVVVAMGRGGPERPEIVDGSSHDMGIAELLAWSRQGRHAASDHFEDAVLARTTTVGCRRCGGGMAGAPFISNVREGALVANSLGPSFVIFEGSGAAIPPVKTDARLLVAGAHQPEEYLTGYLGAYRVLASDAVVLAMAEEPLASPAKVRHLIDELRGLKAGMAVVPVVFRPAPARPVAGRRVALFTTAPVSQEGLLRRCLEERWGCEVVLFSPNLSNRPALVADLARPEIDLADLVLTEIKAAAIDVVAEEAERRGIAVEFVDNVPEEAQPASGGELAALIEGLAATARQRFEAAQA